MCSPLSFILGDERAPEGGARGRGKIGLGGVQVESLVFAKVEMNRKKGKVWCLLIEKSFKSKDWCSQT